MVYAINQNIGTLARNLDTVSLGYEGNLRPMFRRAQRFFNWNGTIDDLFGSRGRSNGTLDGKLRYGIRLGDGSGGGIGNMGRNPACSVYDSGPQGGYQGRGQDNQRRGGGRQADSGNGPRGSRALARSARR